MFKIDATGFENSSVKDPAPPVPDFNNSNPNRDKQIEKLRKGEDITVNSVEEARDILDHMPELKPGGGGDYIPGTFDPSEAYRGNLINKADPNNTIEVHSSGPTKHRYNAHYNLTLRDSISIRLKPAILIKGE
ncbi:hypothetical protein N2K86_20925 [Enterobacter mori]|uniref:hypothetical protein n=1 Tax=Enterobacter mori TaxID=539813 RepID=UPI0021B12101|nr:hypothetical protein [Enterobacter mori]UWX93073.1 hypothetical protein N2K86_20925 [Enterobacter mori]